jgi:hypothetical protein
MKTSSEVGTLFSTDVLDIKTGSGRLRFAMDSAIDYTDTVDTFSTVNWTFVSVAVAYNRNTHESTLTFFQNKVETSHTTWSGLV